MNATVEAQSDVASAKSPSTRRPRESGQARARKSGNASARVSKRSDPDMAKCFFYLPRQLYKKIAMRAIDQGCDQSDLVVKVLGPAFSSVAFYDGRSKSPAEAISAG